MIYLSAETPRDQEIIEKFQRAYVNLKKIVDKLQDENRKLKEELEEYRKRHLSNIGEKNGKSYEIIHESGISEDANAEKRKPGAQPGHKGHFRRVPKMMERITVVASDHICPE
jgi:Skp family chaperone for outer membrane proteins